MTREHVRAVTRMSHTILGYFSVFALGEIAQAIAPVIFFGRPVFRISTGTEAFVILVFSSHNTCWIDSHEVRPWSLATLFPSPLVMLLGDHVAYCILWLICSTVEQAMNKYFSPLPDALVFCGRNKIFVRTLLLPYEREWILCEVTRVGTLIVATIYLQLIQNRYMFRRFTVLQCSHQHCVQSVSSDMEVVGYL